MTNALLSGDTDFQGELEAKRSEIREDLEAIAVMERRYGSMLKTESQWQAVRTGWEALESRLGDIGREESFAGHTEVIKNILALIARVGDTSHLVIDQARDSHYLMDTVVRKMPELLEAMGVLRGRSAGAAAEKRLTEDGRIALIGMLATVRNQATAARTNIEQAMDNNPALKPTLSGPLGVFFSTVQRFLKTIEKKLIGVGRHRMITALPHDLFDTGTAAINAALSLNAEVIPVLEGLLVEHQGKAAPAANTTPARKETPQAQETSSVPIAADPARRRNSASAAAAV